MARQAAPTLATSRLSASGARCGQPLRASELRLTSFSFFCYLPVTNLAFTPPRQVFWGVCGEMRRLKFCLHDQLNNSDHPPRSAAQLEFLSKGVLMRSFVGLLLAFSCSLLLNSPVHAQNAGQGRKATITGRVMDSSGGVLQGAQITVEPKGVNVVSDAQGQFFVNDLEPGSYTVTVTYVGFAEFTQAVTITAGQAASVEAKLGPESQNLQVLVTAERALGEAEAVNRERTADNIVQVQPADVIRSLPNANMADALGRLPSVTIERDEGEGKYVQVRGTEPRLTNTTIDGINVPSPESGVRQIKFDAIPADIVESVEINKTLQANMDGDGIGGSINLVTKTAGERPTMNFSS